MGILAPEKSEQKPAVNPKRKSTGLDFSSLKPLTSTGTKGFSGYRDSSVASPPFGKAKKKKDDDEMDSDADDEDEAKVDDDDEADTKDAANRMLSPEDALRQGELAEGVRKIKVRFF